jgi:hypothetical protein
MDSEDEVDAVAQPVSVNLRSFVMKRVRIWPRLFIEDIGLC